MTDSVSNVPKDVHKEIIAAMKLKAKAKGLETEAELLTENAKNILLPLMSAYEFSKYVVKGLGNVGRRMSKGSRIDGSKLKEKLLIAGVDIEVIESAIGDATKSWETEYVQFTPEK